VFLLLFVYVFGGQLGAGLVPRLTGGHAGRGGYVNYVTPGILLMTVAAAVQGTAIVVPMDMTGGIIDRFRTMAIACHRRKRDRRDRLERRHRPRLLPLGPAPLRATPRPLIQR
jgi:hypothetical protein